MDTFIAITGSLISMILLIPIAFFSLTVFVRYLLKLFGIDKNETHESFDGVRKDPKAFALLIGLSIIGLCLLIGGVL